MLISEIYQPTTRTIHQDTSVGDALAALIQNDINGFVVVNDKEEIVGIFSTQDLAAATVPAEFKENTNLATAMYRKGFFHEICQGIKDKPIKEFMHKNIITVTPDTHIIVVAADFLKNDLYVVPVVENGHLIGIITRSNIKKAIAKAMNIIK